MNDFHQVHGRSRDTLAVADQKAHSRSVRAMFARISGVYDFMNHFLSLNQDRRWRRRLAARLDPACSSGLDLCAGTGDLALACLRAGRGKHWVAADFCPEMLGAAHGKKNTDRLLPTAADAMGLPFAKDSFDAVTVGFGVRNFADVRRGLTEIVRVLRPGGQLLVLDFFRDAPAASGPARGPAPVVRAGLNGLVPLLGKLVGGDGSAYGYLPSSMQEFLSPDQFAGLLGEFGFEATFIERQTLGIAHLVGGRLAP